MVIEAIAEDARTKREAFRGLEAAVSERCILASNTSSLSITGIAGACAHPGRVLGIHFFNPAPLLPLVEIVPGRHSDVPLFWQHWRLESPLMADLTVAITEAYVTALLRHTGLMPAAVPAPPAPRCAEVTLAVTAATAGFTFVQPYRGGDIIPQRNTLIALDGASEIRTPHDDCLLVMPSLRPSRGHTAVRLARFV